METTTATECRSNANEAHIVVDECLRPVCVMLISPVVALNAT